MCFCVSGKYFFSSLIIEEERKNEREITKKCVERIISTLVSHSFFHPFSIVCNWKKTLVYDTWQLVFLPLFLLEFHSFFLFNFFLIFSLWSFHSDSDRITNIHHPIHISFQWYFHFYAIHTFFIHSLKLLSKIERGEGERGGNKEKETKKWKLWFTLLYLLFSSSSSFVLSSLVIYFLLSLLFLFYVLYSFQSILFWPVYSVFKFMSCLIFFPFVSIHSFSFFWLKLRERRKRGRERHKVREEEDEDPNQLCVDGSIRLWTKWHCFQKRYFVNYNIFSCDLHFNPIFMTNLSSSLIFSIWCRNPSFLHPHHFIPLSSSLTQHRDQNLLRKFKERERKKWRERELKRRNERGRKKAKRERTGKRKKQEVWVEWVN